MKDTVCPLLCDPNCYTPDTIDLVNNDKERQYWFTCLQKMVEKFIDKAGVLNPDYPEATDVAKKCFNSFAELIQQLQKDPNILNQLSIRTLLEFNEKTLRENNFKDAWQMQKQQETEAAFRELPYRLKHLDSLVDAQERWLQIGSGMLAGNMFDWGAKAVTDILEISDNFGLQQAMQLIQKRPWFKDDMNEWVQHVQRRPYKLAVIFVDNAGMDFVLGALPFVRELLKDNTKVILSGNTLPALNDITHRELDDCLQRAKTHCPIIRTAIDQSRLIAMENGQRGPCLDLSNLDKDLCEAMIQADLIVLEGMGRAIHTNYNAKFKVDSLKIAVLKNEWLAHSLGAEQFSVVFRFVPV